MCPKIVLIMFLFSCLAICDCALYSEQNVESRGKKKKIAYFVYFADLVLKKFFILKLIYAFVFWCIIHKAGYFLSWFISYLKEQKHDHHHDHHPHFDHGPQYEYGHQPYGPPQYSSYGPYRRKWKN